MINISITSEHFDSSKNIISVDKFSPRSYVHNYFIILYSNLSNTLGTLKDVTNTSRYISLRGFFVNAAYGVTTMGIVVGTSSTPVSYADYKLLSPISHGTGAGQLLYEAVTFPVGVNYANNQSLIQIKRTFINNSGATITVNECGLYINVLSYTYGFLIERTIYNKTIPDGDGINLTYEFSKVY